MTRLTFARLYAELRPATRRHRARLLALRGPQALRETSLDFRPSRLVFDRSEWVSAWLDPRQSVLSRDGTLIATRAITPRGRLLWLVRKCGLCRAYHSRAEDAFAAMEEAEISWRRRRAQRAAKDEVRTIVRDLRRFRVRYRVTLEDAYRSPLCDEGVDGFLLSLGITGFRSYPGWLIAWLYAIDRQVGFVLYEAHLRHCDRTGPAEACQSQQSSSFGPH